MFAFFNLAITDLSTSRTTYQAFLPRGRRRTCLALPTCSLPCLCSLGVYYRNPASFLRTLRGSLGYPGLALQQVRYLQSLFHVSLSFQALLPALLLTPLPHSATLSTVTSDGENTSMTSLQEEHTECCPSLSSTWMPGLFSSALILGWYLVPVFL